MCNSTGAVLTIAYVCLFAYLAESKEKRCEVQQSAFVGLLIFVTITVTVLGFNLSSPGSESEIFGIICVIAQICAFASPLAVVRTALRTRSNRYMPLPLTLAIVVNCSVWTAYGCLVVDPFVIACNAGGLVLGAAQLAVWLGLGLCCTPVEAGEAAPLTKKASAP